MQGRTYKYYKDSVMVFVIRPVRKNVQSVAYCGLNREHMKLLKNSLLILANMNERHCDSVNWKGM